MTYPTWAAIAAHVLVAIAAVADRFTAASRWADAFEARWLPPWFRWSRGGDPVTWLHHGLIAAGVALYGAAWGWALPMSTAAGATIGAVFAAVLYAVREILGAMGKRRARTPHVWRHPDRHRVGWAVDGIMDVVGPGLVLAACVWWLRS